MKVHKPKHLHPILRRGPISGRLIELGISTRRVTTLFFLADIFRAVGL